MSQFRISNLNRKDNNNRNKMLRVRISNLNSNDNNNIREFLIKLGHSEKNINGFLSRRRSVKNKLASKQTVNLLREIIKKRLASKQTVNSLRKIINKSIASSQMATLSEKIKEIISGVVEPQARAKPPNLPPKLPPKPPNLPPNLPPKPISGTPQSCI